MLDDDSSASTHPETVKSEADLLSGLRSQYLANSMRKSEALIFYISRLLADADRSIEAAESHLQSASSNARAESAIFEGSRDLCEALRLSHNFIGSGSSYGFHEITGHARCIEERLKRFKAEMQLTDLLDALTVACLLREMIRSEFEKHKPMR